MNTAWYLSRSAGFVLYLLLFAVVVLGLSVRTRALDRFTARWRVMDIHVFLSVLTVGFIAIHAGALLWDTYIGYSVRDILVPFSTAYRSTWTAVGIGTAYLLIVIAISFPARRWTGYAAWRALHYGAFAAYVGGLAHGIFVGSDSHAAWAQLLYVSTAGVVLGLVVFRIAHWSYREIAVLDRRDAEVRQLRDRAARRRALEAFAARREAITNRAFYSGAAAVGITGLLVLAAGIGPFHWFGIGGGRASEERVQANEQVEGGALTEFVDSFSGTARIDSGSTRRFTLEASATGEQDVRVEVQIEGRPTTDGQLLVTSNSFSLSDASGAELCSGQVEQLTDAEMVADCTGVGPYESRRLNLSMTFQSGLGEQVSGTLQAAVVG